MAKEQCLKSTNRKCSSDRNSIVLSTKKIISCLSKSVDRPKSFPYVKWVWNSGNI